jgi:hypothetical protein
MHGARGGALEGKQNGNFRCSSVAKMRAALEKAGVEFIAKNGGGGGAIKKRAGAGLQGFLKAFQTRKRVAPVVI